MPEPAIRNHPGRQICESNVGHLLSYLLQRIRIVGWRWMKSQFGGGRADK
jgi:hypothetical protein